MLSLARTFFMVPLDLNQLCRLFCRTVTFSLVRCFHSRDKKTVRILADRNEEFAIHSQVTSVAKCNMCRESATKTKQTLTSVVVSRNWSYLCWMVERLQPWVLRRETSPHHASHWLKVIWHSQWILLAAGLLLLTRSIQIKRHREVQADHDGLWWINPPGLGHFLL